MYQNEIYELTRKNSIDFIPSPNQIVVNRQNQLITTERVPSKSI